MHPSFRSLLLMTAVISLPSIAIAQQVVGVNAVVRNQVQMKTATDAALRPARVREDVHIGDNVATGGASSLQVLLRDQTALTVGANARMTIDRFVYDPSRSSADVAATVAKGAFRFASGRPGNAGAKSVNTPGASIGVRGTLLTGVVGTDVADVLSGERGVPPLGGDLDNLTLLVLGGPGSTSATFDKPGAIDVSFGGGEPMSFTQAGQAVLLIPGQRPFGPFRLSDTAMARIAALLAPLVGGAGGQSAPVLDSVTVASGLDLTKLSPELNLGLAVLGPGNDGRLTLPPQSPPPQLPQVPPLLPEVQPLLPQVPPLLPQVPPLLPQVPVLPPTLPPTGPPNQGP